MKRYRKEANEILYSNDMMNSYDLINMYYNFIFNNDLKSFLRVYENYEHIVLLRQWLKNNNISLSFINQVYEDNYMTVYRAKNLEKYDIAFKTSFQKDFNQFQKEESEKYQVLFLSGHYPISSMIDIKDYQNNDVRSFLIDDIVQDDLSIDGPYVHFLQALYQIDRWPGILVFTDKQTAFFSIDQKSDVDEIFKLIYQHKVFEKSIDNEQDNYFIQLSDLHLGTKTTDYGLSVLYNNLDELYATLPQKKHIKFLITGDLMNSPNRKNMYAASTFMNHLKRRYHGDVTFVLGNHDVIVHGLNLLKRQKTKVVAYLLGENIKVFHDLKMIVIKIDSTSQGNLARGKVDPRLLQEIEDELLSIENLEEYTLIAMLHHHILPLKKDEFLKVKWNEKLFMGKIADSTKALQDADDVLQWLNKFQIRYVFHGHKHIPCVVKKDQTYIMAGGASCGGETKERKSRYLNYNLLKFNKEKKRFQYCFIFYDDMTKKERHRVRVTLLKGDEK